MLNYFFRMIIQTAEGKNDTSYIFQIYLFKITIFAFTLNYISLLMRSIRISG